MVRYESLAARSRGVFLGAAVGDALGWPQEQNSNIVGGARSRHVDPVAEFRNWHRYAGGQFNKYTDPVAAGGYSDDTQLILATARALQSDDWFNALARRELPLFLLYSRGAGGATLRACRAWAIGPKPWIPGRTTASSKLTESYFRAGGNGVAMRIAPHVVVHAKHPTEELVARVVHDGITTHGHPRALVGAAAYAVAMHLLLNTERTLEFGELPALVQADKSWQRVETLTATIPSDWLDAAALHHKDLIGFWNQTVNEMLELLSTIDTAARAGTRGDDMGTLERLGVFDKKVNGSGTITSAAAIYLASRNAPRPMSGLLRPAFLKNADTDTLASMTGALLGALHGPDWLADLRTQIQDHAYIEQTADDITARALGETRPTTPTTPTKDHVHDRSLRRFKDQLRVGQPGPLTLPDGREGHVLRDNELEGSTVRAHRWVIQVDGQTLIVDQTAKLTDAEKAERTERTHSDSPTLPTDTGKNHHHGRFAGLTLRANDLRLLERFYGDELGLRVARIGTGALIVDGRIRFIEDRNADRASSQVLLSFDLEDLPEVARRLKRSTRELGGTLRSVDPAGNDIEIRPLQET